MVTVAPDRCSRLRLPRVEAGVTPAVLLHRLDIRIQGDGKTVFFDFKNVLRMKNR